MTEETTEIDVPEILDEPEENPEPDPVPAMFTPLGAPMSDATSTIGFSYEVGVDVKVGDEWQTVRFISSVNPSSAPKELDAATYDDKGDDHPISVGETTQLDFYVQQHRLSDGSYLPEVEALLEAARTKGGSIPVRWYDNPSEGTPNADDAFQADATVSATRAQTGNAEIGGWNFSLKCQGSRTKIANPAATPAAG